MNNPVYYETFVGPLITEANAPLLAVVLGLPLMAGLCWAAWFAAVWIWKLATEADREEE